MRLLASKKMKTKILNKIEVAGAHVIGFTDILNELLKSMLPAGLTLF